ncbi:hypothetical protein [Microbacterium arabinogalactanolyticum]|uniref:hypothetical protein n=1 Tax=Microbacterium arabinogalactanolyticum TaxID=69365 RepID=UPI002555998B|nr:hypothetical protein [Microbacterium arabinogalactanolyticum]GLC85361.1 hypothetical protein MIAR_19480 [Microbacterium arabinogalactanolyticum]
MGTRTRRTAYVLLADPSYLRESIGAYYDRVDRIVVSYDRSHTSWTGTPLPLQQCLRLISDLDRDSKMVLAPGDFARPGETGLANDTHQRQVALDQASEGSDWVLQLDTDEVMVSPDVFFDMLNRAESAGARGLDFPSRWLYTRTGPGRYLEVTRRFWGVAASYPGPLAVRAGTTLRHARQADIDLFRVDFAPRNTDPWRPPDAEVHAVITPDKGVLHFSWVREPDVIKRKFGWSGHSEHMQPPEVYRRWVWRTRHPLLTAVTTPLRRRDDGRYRLSRIPEPPGGEPIRVIADGETV